MTITRNFAREITVLDLILGEARIGRHYAIERIPFPAADIVADLGTLFPNSRQGLRMRIHEQFVSNQVELVSQIGYGRAEVFFAQLDPAGEMAFDEPAEDPTGKAPERQFGGLEMKIHQRSESVCMATMPQHGLKTPRSNTASQPGL
jgi:hypothetical protein